MAKTIDLVQRSYTGLELRGGVLWLNPDLPDDLPSLRFEIGYRGQWLAIGIDRRRLRIAARPGVAPPIRIGLPGRTADLAAGQTLEFDV